MQFFFLQRASTSAPNTDYSYWVSQNVFSMYQLMFAIITPALIVGAIAERMKFTADHGLHRASGCSSFISRMAHMVWGIDGLMNGVWNPAAKIKAIDFAGGTVVHMTSGWRALVLCIILGKRLGFGKEKMAPHSMVLCMVGTGMLWVGWYGFNAGSRRRRRRRRRQRLHDHHARRGHCRLSRGRIAGMDLQGQRLGPRLLLGRRRRPRRHHAGLRFRERRRAP